MTEAYRRFTKSGPRQMQISCICCAVRGDLIRSDLDQILNVGPFDLDEKLKINTDSLKEESPFEWAGVYDLKAGVYHLEFQVGPDPIKFQQDRLTALQFQPGGTRLTSGSKDGKLAI